MQAALESEPMPDGRMPTLERVGRFDVTGNLSCHTKANLTSTHFIKRQNTSSSVRFVCPIRFAFSDLFQWLTQVTIPLQHSWPGSGEHPVGTCSLANLKVIPSVNVNHFRSPSSRAAISSQARLFPSSWPPDSSMASSCCCFLDCILRMFSSMV